MEMENKDTKWDFFNAVLSVFHTTQYMVNSLKKGTFS